MLAGHKEHIPVLLGHFTAKTHGFRWECGTLWRFKRPISRKRSMFGHQSVGLLATANQILRLTFGSGRACHAEVGKVACPLWLVVLRRWNEISTKANLSLLVFIGWWAFPLCFLILFFLGMCLPFWKRIGSSVSCCCRQFTILWQWVKPLCRFSLYWVIKSLGWQTRQAPRHIISFDLSHLQTLRRLKWLKLIGKFCSRYLNRLVLGYTAMKSFWWWFHNTVLICVSWNVFGHLNSCASK